MCPQPISLNYQNSFTSSWISEPNMETSDNKKQLEMLREAGLKAGIVPVQNLFNEDQRVAEVKRLGILDLNLR